MRAGVDTLPLSPPRFDRAGNFSRSAVTVTRWGRSVRQCAACVLPCPNQRAHVDRHRMRLSPRVGFSAATAGCSLPRAAHGFWRPESAAGCRARWVSFHYYSYVLCPLRLCPKPSAPSSEFGSDFRLDLSVWKWKCGPRRRDQRDACARRYRHGRTLPPPVPETKATRLRPFPLHFPVAMAWPAR